MTFLMYKDIMDEMRIKKNLKSLLYGWRVNFKDN